MLIDTGSDISWVSCSSCSNCPRTSELGVEMNFYDADNSSTSSVISCSASICTSDECSETNQCAYSLHYADNSGTSGYFVSDLFYFDKIMRTSLISKSSTSIIFGCSTCQLGHLILTDGAVDGILGFGQQRLSIISQLSSHGISPKSFSHYLKGEGSGGGILVLGEILHPSMVYTPLAPSKGHYSVYLQSISVHGRILPIHPEAFANSGDRGTIVDSGTSLVYLVAEAYESVVDAITVVVSPSAKPITSAMYPCYLISSSFAENITEVFPTISLNFAGDASMNLTPTDYLDDMGFVDGAAKWCIRFIKSGLSLTILGDVALKDRIIVYDLARQRIGWANYNCSLPVNVSITSGTYDVTQASTIYHMLEIILFFLYLFWTND
ncbi:aspartic proteinase 36-like isoform X1 [Solanum lycopersicum]|uniref:aspartic proteinase 36-like isoform X1 n=1 Tax=Solanum lycopersicum TaxID=4081 RepID=UPI0008FEBB4A|nr:aspartic proteinase-like protein 2 [Solanum lycopersicum]XP_019069801.1 aspartic proteinase-like protein 2 [Solanum lycopersicum]XP_019069803.1 aspartic proteinase-like protein 2 [Solanum lycopersicum]